jgi:pilus assembly protein CpaD
MTALIPADRNRLFRAAAALVGVAVVLGGCNTDRALIASVPEDYRLRHPIAIQEANQSVVIFVGQARGGLSASQRADVVGLAQTWLREGTGAISADVPVGTPNARAAARDCCPPLSSGRPANARDNPPELSENLGNRRALRPVA